MDEIKLIEMMSYLDPELLENDFIEKDIKRFNNFIIKMMPTDKSILSSVIKIITFISTFTVFLVGVIMFIIKRKNGFKFGRKGSKLSEKVVGAVIS